MQTLLKLDQLDPWILEELEQNTGICTIDTPNSSLELVCNPDLDLIDSLLQANCTARLLQELREKASKTLAQPDYVDYSQYSPIGKNNWVLEKGLLKYQGCLVVLED